MRTALAVAVGLALTLGACTSETSEEAHDHHTSPTVFDLAAGPVPADEPTAAEVAPASELSALVESALGEHALLVHAMMTAVADGAAIDESIAALSTNTAELSALIGLAYGSTGATAFAQIWNQHTQFFADYAAARAAGDDDAIEEAFRALHDYQHDFASFLSTATDEGTPRDPVAELLGSHVDHLTGALDAHVAGDPQTEAALMVEGHAHMYGIGTAVAAAIAQQQPERFPTRAAPQAERRRTLRRLLTAHVTLLLLDDGAHRDTAAAVQVRNELATELDLTTDELSDWDRAVGGSWATTLPLDSPAATMLSGELAEILITADDGDAGAALAAQASALDACDRLADLILAG